MQYLITGGSGMIGRRLIAHLLESGHKVRVLSRSAQQISGVDCFQWDIEKGEIQAGALEAVDCVIHLAGAGIVDKSWTEKRKKEIIDSRVKPLAFLAKAFQKEGLSPKTLVSASGVGYYGFDSGDDLQTEIHEPGTDYIADVVLQWEAAAANFGETLNCRVAKLRIGIVLSASGGALGKMDLPVKMGAGSPLGSGEQWMSWIHIDDLCRLFLMASLNKNFDGRFNAVSPNAEKNNHFMQVLAKVLDRPFWMPNVPESALKLMMGERAQLVLGGNKVSAAKVLANGFNFQFESLEPALRDIYKK
ncbi:TIGR01777 family oxidoreductase [Marinilongibacter aquaticus]|uniref:TIGR01777 family oxidoreductase n=1 Tax=Marinilongibacter aquaticus TaxID=2975157 RepID=UPI0021BDCA19|nr:TIGR01777 family oxidoreductase [Marinilongibacter aquaticus]UBM60212.1 TIGR01777 family oxidoreductase [Marinilongibacter aquaticus]